MKTKSFTLIEVLVALVILGILSTFIIISLSSVIDSSNDAKRKKDLDSVSKMLMTYGVLNGSYPVDDCNIGEEGCLEELSEYTSSFPKDPNGDSYHYSSDGSTYTITANLSDGQELTYNPEIGFSQTEGGGEGGEGDPFVDPIVNGSFDGTWTGWTAAGGSTKSVSDTSAYAGSYTSLINYGLDCLKAEIYQNITIPDVVGKINLEFWERTYFHNWAGAGGVKFNDDWLFCVGYWVSGRIGTTNWAKQTIDVSAYKGQTVKLAFVWEDYNYCTNGDHAGWIRVDEIVLKVEKEDQAAPSAPTMASRTEDSITLNTITNGEYRRGSGEWQSSAVFSGLSSGMSYSFTQRYKETETHYVSPESLSASFSTEGEWSGGGNWLSGYGFRKPITLNNSGSELTDYQVKIDVTYDSDMQADFKDLRFTSGDGITELKYWIESKIDSTSAVVWVKVSSILNGDSNIYLYYGNESVNSDSNGNNVFEFFDNFDDGNISDWQLSQGYADGSDAYSISASTTEKISENYSLYLYGKSHCWGSPYDGVITYAIKSVSLNSGNYVVDVYFKGRGAQWAYCGSGQIPDANISIDDNIIYTVSNINYSGCNKVTCNWSRIVSNNFNVSTNNYNLKLRSWATDCEEVETYWDNVIIRKYATSIPSMVIGDEESL